MLHAPSQHGQHTLPVLLPCCRVPPAVLQVPVKDRAGHMVLTYTMDVRIEPVESLQVPVGQAAASHQGGRPALNELLEPLLGNGRVLAGAYGR